MAQKRLIMHRANLWGTKDSQALGAQGILARAVQNHCYKLRKVNYTMTAKGPFNIRKFYHSPSLALNFSSIHLAMAAMCQRYSPPQGHEKIRVQSAC